MITMKPIFLLCILLQYCFQSSAAADHDSSRGTSIIFTTLGRSFYAFDIFTLSTQDPPSPLSEIQITDGQSVNFNGHFPSPSSTLLLNLTRPDPTSLHLIYVSERNGSSNIYYDAVSYATPRTTRWRSDLELHLQLDRPERFQIPLLDNSWKGKNVISMEDKPSLVGDYLLYVSTHEDTGVPRTSWAAVYSTHLKTGRSQRLTPHGVADFSPSVSPSGVRTAVASYGKKGWNGEVEDLSTDIYVFLTRDGTRRVKVVEHGGWPNWVDESTIYFHRRGKDNWWSIYRAILPSHGSITTESVIVERVTPPGLHTFTPATSPGNNKFIALATRRSTSKFRHIELFDLVTGEFKELTRAVSPESHHFNPFISSDSGRVGYHRCRGGGNGRIKGSGELLLENLHSPNPVVSLLRFAGSFPSFSPGGDRIAYVDLPGVYVVNIDGSNPREVSTEMAFPTAWDPVREGIVYTSTGPTFGSVSTEVDVISIDVDSDDLRVKKLTINGQNNAFPSSSPDGKWIVFRSSRSGYKNLYIMDAIEGESGGLYRLTDGPWTDTMCNWSPDGNWIAFASDRHNPGNGSFEIYLIHPNGTGLRKLVQSGSAGRTNHPYFSPDSKSIVFTSDYVGISAEPISNPHQYQPYGEIFTIKLDGSDLKRMTHNSFEDGTPAWSPRYIKPVDVDQKREGRRCQFEDLHWLNEVPSDNDRDHVEAVPYGSLKHQCGV